MKQYKVTVNGTEYEVTIESQGRSTGGYNAPPVSRRTAPPIAAPTEAPVMPAAKEKSVPKIKPGEDGGKNVTSPMNGTIISVKTAVGQTVNAGDMLFVLEAMKMENEIYAPRSGKIASVVVNQGDAVDTNQLLCTFE